jgi:hypothetical protein
VVVAVCPIVFEHTVDLGFGAVGGVLGDHLAVFLGSEQRQELLFEFQTHAECKIACLVYLVPVLGLLDQPHFHQSPGHGWPRSTNCSEAHGPLRHPDDHDLCPLGPRPSGGDGGEVGVLREILSTVDFT